MKWYIKVFENFLNFKGRARRKEFWMFVLINIIILVVLTFTLDFIDEQVDLEITPIIFGTYLMVILVPYLALISRRLHDSGKSGWYFFVYFIPFIGGIWFLILMAAEGESGANQYGPDPKVLNIDEIDDIGKPLLD